MSTAGQIRIGLIGTGRWGSRYLATIARLWDTPEVVVSDTAGGNGRGPAGPVRWPTPAAMVASARMDGVIVASPASTHASVVAGILRRGLPVLVEKPLTPDLPSTERLCSLARRTGTSVLVGHQHLRAPAFEELRRLVRDRAVKKIECLAGGDGPIRSDCDALWDYGPHDLSMVLDLLGRTAPVTVRRSGRRIPGPGSATWIADLEVGAAMVRLEISNALTAKKHQLSVTTADGDVFVYDDFARHRLRANGAAVDVSDELPLDRQVRQFVAQVRAAPGGGDPGELDLAVVIARTLRDIGNASVASAHV